MTARDLISKERDAARSSAARHIDGNATAFDALTRLLESPSMTLGVEENGILQGVIDSRSMLSGLHTMIGDHDDCSVVVVECAPEDYSASLIAHAVEDTDAHLVNLLTAPGSPGHIRVTLQIQARDPQSAVRNLERYGYPVTEAYGEQPLSQGALDERLAALQAFLNV